MLKFDYFRRSGDHYVPHTSTAAFRAAELEMLPIERYVFEATSVKSLTEEPFDVDGIEQQLSRENLDIETNLTLVRALTILLKSESQEIALFAAEGINLIEGRYNKRIEDLKAESGHETNPDSVRELARLYVELSQLYGRQSALRKFYLKEAYQWSSAIEGVGDIDVKSQQRTIRVLIQLGLLDQAASELDRHGKGMSAEFLMLEAEIEYERKNMEGVLAVCRALAPSFDALTEEQRLVVSYWLETDGK